MNLRVIKKDIEFLIGDFVEDCLLFAMLHPDKDRTKVEELIEKASDLADGLFYRVNHPDKSSKKATKAHYKEIGHDLIKGLDGLCEELSALAK